MPHPKRSITIYTDGGADPNPGPGGWGVVLIHGATDRIKELSGGDPDTTNNRMELTAAIRALESLKEPSSIRFFTDSEYLRRGITDWLPKWRKAGWKRKRGRIENLDLWQRLAELADQHDITWEWVKGHAGDQHNERADRLAAAAIRDHYRASDTAASDPVAAAYLLVSSRGSQGYWGALVRLPDGEHLISGHEPDITSNRLDVLAAINALNMIPDGGAVHLYTRSDYLRNGATQWLPAWKKRNWLTKEGQPVKNRDLWEEMDDLLNTRRVEWPSTKDETFDFIFEDVGLRLQEHIESDRRLTWDG